jgi:Tfp pilus assembly protein PilN
MALSPTIPTSFVPRPVAPQRFRADLSGAFGFFGYSVLGAVFVLAIGVFLYGRLLAATQASKDKDLAAAVASIDSNTAQGFIRLHDRLVLSESLLNSHVAFSGLFTVLGKILPTTVRFTSLHITLDTTGASRLEGSGTAKSFNALAAASTAFAADGNIKDAVFSSIKVSRDNSVTFLLSAKLDPKVITFAP